METPRLLPSAWSVLLYQLFTLLLARRSDECVRKVLRANVARDMRVPSLSLFYLVAVAIAILFSSLVSFLLPFFVHLPSSCTFSFS